MKLIREQNNMNWNLRYAKDYQENRPEVKQPSIFKNLRKKGK